jgi:hypothetical protein
MLTKKKRKNTNKSKLRKKNWPNHRSQRITVKITHKQLKIRLSHLSKNPIKENFEENF